MLPTINQNTNNNALYVAFKAKKVKDATDGEIKQAIAYVLVLIGEQKTLETLKTDKISGQVIVDSIRRGYANITVEEIKTAFQLAVDKRFEVNLSLYNRSFNSDYVSTVLHAYQQYKRPFYAAYLQNQNIALPERTGPTEEQKDKAVRKYITNIFNTYKKTGEIKVSHSWIYDYLLNLGIIKPSVELKKQNHTKASQIYKSRLHAEKTGKSSFEILHVIRKIQNKQGKEAVIVIAKEITLKQCFDKINHLNL